MNITAWHEKTLGPEAMEILNECDDRQRAELTKIAANIFRQSDYDFKVSTFNWLSEAIAMHGKSHFFNFLSELAFHESHRRHCFLGHDEDCLGPDIYAEAHRAVLCSYSDHHLWQMRDVLSGQCRCQDPRPQ